jgi:hypothetical protein
MLTKISSFLIITTLLLACNVKNESIFYPNQNRASDSLEFNLLSINGIPIIFDLAEYVILNRNTTIKHLSSVGKVSFLGSGALVKYSPQNLYFETDTIKFSVCNSERQCNELRFRVKIFDKDSVSISDDSFLCKKGAWDDFYTLPSFKPFVCNVLENDYLCLEKLDPSSLTIWAFPKFGRIDKDKSNLIYTPLPSFVGSDTLIYKINSLTRIKKTFFAHVVFNLAACKPAPVFDSISIRPGTTLFTLNVLENDILCNHQLQTKITSKPQHIDIQIISPREWICRLDSSFSRQDEFTYCLVYRLNNKFVETHSAKVIISRR